MIETRRFKNVVFIQKNGFAIDLFDLLKGKLK